EGASSLTTVSVPTALERQGDFSQSPGGVFDPLNGRQPFPGARIPVDRINPLALAALNAMPLPNAGERGFVNAAEILTQDIYNYSARIDVNAAPGSSILARFSLASENGLIPEPVPGRSNIADARPEHVVAGWTKTILTHAVNELRGGISQLTLRSGLPELTF